MSAERRGQPSRVVFLFGEVRVFPRPTIARSKDRVLVASIASGLKNTELHTESNDVDGTMKIEFDEDGSFFRGEILGFLEEPDFYGSNARMNFVESFKKSLDSYLGGLTEEQGLSRETLLSGNFNSSDSLNSMRGLAMTCECRERVLNTLAQEGSRKFIE